jgi:hypothetical protein
VKTHVHPIAALKVIGPTVNDEADGLATVEPTELTQITVILEHVHITFARKHEERRVNRFWCD